MRYGSPVPERPPAGRAAAPVPDSAARALTDCQLRAPRHVGNFALAAFSILGAFVALTILFYFTSAHAVAGNSDGATVILEGQSMSSGHFGLNGWALSSDSFWTVDAVVYMFAVLAAGVHAVLLNLGPALIGAAVVVVGACIVRADWRGTAGFAGMATVVALLALPSHAFAFFLLQGPMHVGTTLWCLLAFLALRTGRFGWGWVVAVILLAAGTVGDLQTIALGVVPALVAGIAASARCRDWRAGLPTSAAALGSVALAVVVREVARAVGTFTLVSSAPRAAVSQMVDNVAILGDYMTKLFGLGPAAFGTGGAPLFTEYAHGIALVVVVGSVLVAVVRLVRGLASGREFSSRRPATWRLDDLLVCAFCGDLVVFLALTQGSAPSDARYLTAAVIFGSVLAARLVARCTARLLVVRRRLAPWAVKFAAVAATAVVGVLATGLAFNLTTTQPTRAYAQIGALLEAHGLHEGVGDYWSSSIVTVETNDDVLVRPVALAPDGRLVRYARESTSSWYLDQHFNFLVYNTLLPFGSVDTATAVATFGRVARTYHLGSLEVLVWAHPFTVSAHGVS